MRIPYLFGALPVIGDNARSVARRAAPFILSALINNTFSVAFRANFFSHLCALQLGNGAWIVNQQDRSRVPSISAPWITSRGDPGFRALGSPQEGAM